MRNGEAVEMARILLGLSEEQIGNIKGFKSFNVKDKNIRIIISN